MQRHLQTLDGISEGMQGIELGPYRRHAGLDDYIFVAMIEEYSRLYPEDELVRDVVHRPADQKTYYRLLRRVLTAWSEDRMMGAPESRSQFRQRVLDAQSMLLAMADSGNRLLVASSGGAISMFIGWVLNLVPEKIFDLNLQLRNTSINHFYLNRSNISLSSFNGIQHLDHPQRTQYITYG